MSNLVRQDQPITPFLWFNDNAEQAVEFYRSVFTDATVDKVVRYGKAGPGPEGSVMTIAFTLRGMQFTALNGGPHFTFSGAISFVVHCDTQAEIDHYWNTLGEGAQIHQCGWLTDRFGVTWQIVPRQLVRLLDTTDQGQYERVMQAMMKMVKLEIAPLEQAAAAGKPGVVQITVETTVAAPLAEVWRAYTTPADIVQWNAASDDWHTTRASVDLRVGGEFSSRMEAKDGSFGFDFAGVYTRVETGSRLDYAFGDRKATVLFTPMPTGVKVTVSFDAEQTHSLEQQQGGWQAILDNFRRHVEGRQPA